MTRDTRPVGRRTLRTFVLGAMVAALGACAGESAGGGAAAPGAAGQAAVAAGGTDIAEVRRFQLTMDRVDRFIDAGSRLRQAVEDDPALMERFDAMEEEDDLVLDLKIGELVDALNREPQARGAIERAGMSVRDYAMMSAIFFPAYTTFKTRQAGVADAPAADWISDQHLAFVERHEEQLDRVLERLRAEAEAGDDMR